MAGMVALVMGCEGGKQDTAFCFDEMTYSPSETVFKLFAPKDAECYVKVGVDRLAMTLKDSIWTVTAKGDRKGQPYVFVVNGQESPGVFAKAVTINGKAGVVVDTKDADPEGWAVDKGVRQEREADWVVYEMHHRDFSVNRPDAVYKGKFLALTEPWAISHLQELGVNAVHILPSYDYGSVDELQLQKPQYNWGDPADPLCRIREFKQMVQALHRAGIGVVLDVVYNHTYDKEHSNFQRTYPEYYYRGDSNGSGCGNETASEQPMMRRFMIESVKYWINEYHIDGFRFDLMGCHDIETMNEIRAAVDAIDPHIFIYGEGWSAGQCALPTEQLGLKANIRQMPRIAAFSDDMRDALRGPFSDDTKGAFLAGIPGEEMSLMAGIAGMVEHPQVDYAKVNYSDEPYALEPTQMMAYVSCHDDMCLVDRLKASIPGLTETALLRLDMLAQTAVFTSQGVPFMLSGEELLRTKQGVHNSFESPDSINQLDWTNKDRYPQLFEYYKRLIALRKAHPAFRLGEAEQVRQHLKFMEPKDGLVGFTLTDVPGDSWQNIVVVLNANKKAVKVDVAEGQYTVVCRDGQINEQGLGQVSGSEVSVGAQSALIMVKDK